MKTREVADRPEIEVHLQKERAAALMRRNVEGTTLAESSRKERGVGKGWRRIFPVHIRAAGKAIREPSICIVIN